MSQSIAPSACCQSRAFRDSGDTRPAGWPQGHCLSHARACAGGQLLPATLLSVGQCACPASASPAKDFRFGCVCENGEIAQLFDTQFPPCKNRGSGFFLQGGLGRRATQSLAEVAELADAHGSGPCTRKGVGVRVPSSAPAVLTFRAARNPCRLRSLFSDLNGNLGFVVASSKARKYFDVLRYVRASVTQLFKLTLIRKDTTTLKAEESRLRNLRRQADQLSRTSLQRVLASSFCFGPAGFHSLGNTSPASFAHLASFAG